MFIIGTLYRSMMLYFHELVSIRARETWKYYFEKC